MSTPNRNPGARPAYPSKFSVFLAATLSSAIVILSAITMLAGPSVLA